MLCPECSLTSWVCFAVVLRHESKTVSSEAAFDPWRKICARMTERKNREQENCRFECGHDYCRRGFCPGDGSLSHYGYHHRPADWMAPCHLARGHVAAVGNAGRHGTLQRTNLVRRWYMVN